MFNGITQNLTAQAAALFPTAALAHSPLATLHPPLFLAFITENETRRWLLNDWRTITLLAVVMACLVAAYIVGQVLLRQPESAVNPAIAHTFSRRVRAWWIMCAILIAAIIAGRTAVTILFGLMSFWALREFITVTPTRAADHRALFWVLFFFCPLQFILVGMGNEYYGLYNILIPVYGFLFIPARIALQGDSKRFLERVAKIQCGMLVCVYALSYTPAILYLSLTTSDKLPWSGSSAGVLFFFLLLTQLNDVLQYAWGLWLGKRSIAPAISSSRTWEGFLGALASVTLLGSLLFWVTPFNIWQAACMAAVIAVMGSAGGLTMSAIKRDRGVKDYGTLVEGHAGVLDRIDSICFAAPVFFHLTRYYFTAGG